MAKRNIEVKEKALIEKLNNAVEGKKPYETPTTYVWDNNGPVQFDVHVDTAKDKDYTDYTVYKVGENFKDVNKDKFFKPNVVVEPKTVCLTPRNPDGSFVEHYNETLCDNKDNAESRVSTNKQNDLAYIEKMRATLAEARNKDTQMRTPFDSNTPLGPNSAINRARDIEKAMVDAELKPLKEKYEEVNHPDHYNQYDVEVIDMMERVFGLYDTYAFCKLNAFKYRQRMGNKPGQDILKDLAKEKWYLTRAENIKSRMTDTDRERATEFSKKIEKL